MPRIRFEMKYSKTEREKMEANVLGDNVKNIVPKKRNEFALFCPEKNIVQKKEGHSATPILICVRNVIKDLWDRRSLMLNVNDTSPKGC